MRIKMNMMYQIDLGSEINCLCWFIHSGLNSEGGYSFPFIMSFDQKLIHTPPGLKFSCLEKKQKPEASLELPNCVESFSLNYQGRLIYTKGLPTELTIESCPVCQL